MVEELLAGHRRFLATDAVSQRDVLRRLAIEGQRPYALFISCSDSRVVPELITGAGPGDLFVVRDIANHVPGWTGHDTAVAAAIEYALEQLRVPDLIVCGHDGCGGVAAALDSPLPPRSRSRLARWLRGIAPAVARARAEGGAPSQLLSRAVEENVLESLANLAAYPAVAQARSAGRLRLHGWVYDLVETRLRAYDPSLGRFLLVT